ncbi:hypothetical protein HJC10_41660 [Corallococcus exiguus]|nr:hypothetical protein [Corallococcus exiguus]RKH73665.1 hypothetical protein D7X99_41290 [Corallococcus sp. AB032C]NNB90889.1 hypothetical protein [Corallococcus exiguus]NNC00037.1 hypothetical protein [Corallococcus exiguus]NNC09310.1 hypothetical protein [Corallococcus exiguus]NPC53444.1 hypothetical protein [Corallococcus exiguus]
MPAGDNSIPIGLIRDVADAFLKRPGARACDPATLRPIQGLSTEYCATVYVAGGRESLSWRVSEPVRGSHSRCSAPQQVQDADHPASQVWVVGFIHNHPCGSPPSSVDLMAWPTDAIDPLTAMAVVRLVPGNPAPALFKSLAIEMTSALVAERMDGSRVYLRYFPTGEVEQWSERRRRWILLGTCAPTQSHLGAVPQCTNGPLRLLRE